MFFQPFFCEKLIVTIDYFHSRGVPQRPPMTENSAKIIKIFSHGATSIIGSVNPTGLLAVCVFVWVAWNQSCDWLRRQFLAVVLASQLEVACICTLSAFYHLAKQHSKGVSTQASDEKNRIEILAWASTLHRGNDVFKQNETSTVGLFYSQ